MNPKYYRRKKAQAFKKIYLQAQANKMSKKMTAPEKVFDKILKSLNVEYATQKLVGYYIFDFYIPSINTLIEVDGDYYHANPEKYEDSQLNEMQIKNKKRDKKKEIYAKGVGYKVERFWETDIHNNEDFVRNRLSQIL